MLNRTRLSSLDAFGLRDQRNRIYPALEASDGSTLSLDFTQMSSLDSRFTFDRSNSTTSGGVGTATFINSSGWVQLADHNLVGNSAFAGSSVGTGWTPPAGGTFVNSGGSITVSVTTSNQSWIARTFVTKPGIRYSASVNVTSIAGTLNYNQVFAVAGSFTADTFYRNGSQVTASNTAQTGLLTIIFTAGASGTNTFRAGVGASGTNQANVTVVFDSPRAVEGEITQPTYFVSPSGSEYQAPRFDYNPTTLAPRGLLIEGSATNLATHSNNFSNAVWSLDTASGTNPTVSTVSQTGPDGASTVTRIILDKTGGLFSRVLQSLTGTTSQPYTISVWMKANTANGGASTQNVGLRIGSDSSGFNCVVTTTWKRFQYTYTLSGSTDAAAQILLWDNITGNDETADVLVYGCQLEAGSGASSYIPTATAAVTRAADQCFIADASPFQVSTTNGTLYWSGIIHKQAPSGYVEIVGFMDSNSPTNPRPTFEVFTNSTNIGVAARGGNLNTGGANEVYRGYTLNAQTRYACSVNTTSDPIVAAVLNGGAVGTNTKTGTGDLFASTKFVLGRQLTSSYATTLPCMTFAQVKYWPVTKTQAELNLLTTT